EIANLELGSRHVAVAGALEREDRGLRGRRPDPDDAFDPPVSPDEVHAPARVTVALGTRACAHGREDEIDEPVAVEIAQSDGRASISASFAIGVDRPLAELLVVLEEPRARDRDRDADELEPRQEKEKPGGRRKKPGPLSRMNDSHEMPRTGSRRDEHVGASSGRRGAFPATRSACIDAGGDLGFPAWRAREP